MLQSLYSLHLSIAYHLQLLYRSQSCTHFVRICKKKYQDIGLASLFVSLFEFKQMIGKSIISQSVISFIYPELYC